MIVVSTCHISSGAEALAGDGTGIAQCRAAVMDIELRAPRSTSRYRVLEAICRQRLSNQLRWCRCQRVVDRRLVEGFPGGGARAGDSTGAWVGSPVCARMRVTDAVKTRPVRRVCLAKHEKGSGAVAPPRRRRVRRRTSPWPRVRQPPPPGHRPYRTTACRRLAPHCRSHTAPVPS